MDLPRPISPAERDSLPLAGTPLASLVLWHVDAALNYTGGESMAQSAMDVTRQEFEDMKTEHQRLSIAVEGLLQGQLTLTRDVAELSERMNDGFDLVNARLDRLEDHER
jgi:hypothetical protein